MIKIAERFDAWSSPIGYDKKKHKICNYNISIKHVSLCVLYKHIRFDAVVVFKAY